MKQYRIIIPKGKTLTDFNKELKPVDELEKILKSLGLKYLKEYIFDELTGRKWRFDFALPLLKIGIEYNGGIHFHTKTNKGKHKQGSGGHTIGKGLVSDYDKMNCAVSQGWRVIVLCRNHFYVPASMTDTKAKHHIYQVPDLIMRTVNTVRNGSI